MYVHNERAALFVPLLDEIKHQSSHLLYLMYHANMESSRRPQLAVPLRAQAVLVESGHQHLPHVYGAQCRECRILCLRRVAELTFGEQITLTGFAFVLINIATMLYYTPNMDQDCPTWVYWSWAIGLFLYQTFDAVDGSQAYAHTTTCF